MPTLLFLHEWGFIEVLMFWLVFQLVSELALVNNEVSTGTYLMIPCIVLVMACFGYSTLIHTQKMRTPADPKKLQMIVTMWTVTYLYPLSILLQSVMFGYFTFAILF